MEWGNKDHNSYLCVFGSQRAWISALISLIPLLIFVGYFVGFGLYFLPIFLTFTILILSTTLFTLSSKPSKPVPNTPIIPHQKIPFRNSEEKQHDHENKANQQHKQAQEEEEEKEEEQAMMSLSSSPDSMSSESEWLNFSDDGSISDEESLIEIALPSGHVEFDDHKTKIIPSEDLFPHHQCSFKQRSLMELIAEINEIIIEEDNLIEIDISIGSIKCSRFEIEA